MTDTYKSDQIGYTKIKDTVVSTIKLPMAHGDYMYETMTYDAVTGKFSDYQQRYKSEENAVLGHVEAVIFITDYKQGE